jgi:hypothetical protein
VFQTFVKVLEGNTIDITDKSDTRLSKLSDELGFDGLDAELSAFQPSTGFVKAMCCISELTKCVKENKL